jgi:heat shock protein HspQ
VSDPVKRIVLSRYWVGDFVFHRIHGERGLITSIQFVSDRLVPRYYCVFNTNTDGWTDEMELSAEKVFEGTGDAKT